MLSNMAREALKAYKRSQAYAGCVLYVVQAPDPIALYSVCCVLVCFFLVYVQLCLCVCVCECVCVIRLSYRHVNSQILLTGGVI